MYLRPSKLNVCTLNLTRKEYSVCEASCKTLLCLSRQKYRMKVLFYICLCFDLRINVLLAVEGTHHLAAAERKKPLVVPE